MRAASGPVFRIFVLPFLLAAPMVAFSLDPGRFFHEPRCVAFFALMVIGLAVEHSIVDTGRDRKSTRLNSSHRH